MYWYVCMTKKNILIVEDDDTYLKLFKKVIKELGTNNIFAASNAEEAFKIIESEPIDLLVSDILLQKMNGYKLAQLVRAHHPHAEILLTTGYQTDLDRFDFRGVRCHLLHKPYHKMTDVSTLIERLLNKKNVFEGMDEDSFGENEICPEITEWTL